jgi:benzoate-CoA ligase
MYTEENGCYTYQGRADDMFKVGASWVSPVRVEEVLRQHPAVLECAVTWRKLESLVKPLAYVVLNAGFSGDMKLSRDIRAFILGHLPEYMCPVQFVYTEEIPKTRTGKVQRYVLRTKENN